MDIIIPLLFLILGFLMLFLAFIEEKYASEGDEDGNDSLVIFLTALATIFLFLGGITSWYITDTYYSGLSDSLVETAPLVQYRPIGWLGIGFALFSALLTAVKMFDTAEKHATR